VLELLAPFHCPGCDKVLVGLCFLVGKGDAVGRLIQENETMYNEMK